MRCATRYSGEFVILVERHAPPERVAEIAGRLRTPAPGMAAVSLREQMRGDHRLAGAS